MPLASAREKGLVVDLEPRAAYFEHLKTLVDLEVLRGSGLKVVVDVLYRHRPGLPGRLSPAGRGGVELLNATVTLLRRALGRAVRGIPPGSLGRVRATGAHLGLAVDADADRFGLWSCRSVSGRQYVLGLLFDYLIETRGWDGGVARSVATTTCWTGSPPGITARYYVTKVGFKHLGEYINRDQVVMVGEESEGFSMKHHLPEKDGILAGVLVAEMVARTRKGLPNSLPTCLPRWGRSTTAVSISP